ncbi:MAG: tRNA pseudouridine(38-40) synthase TruA [Chloroflexi bacterium]|nr:tRNA pseudouridine(38-40) synthase TruA [Chloroflexota bacterium]
MRNLMLLVEYDGTDYQGFQWQVGRPTIQGGLEKALEAVTGQRTRVIGAGRTDAGVHARGQVVSCRSGTALSPDQLRSALNARLPKDIAVKAISPAAEGFHTRFAAKSREYRYTIWNSNVRSPLAWRYAFHFSKPLEAEAMHTACRSLIGTHDFASFGSRLWERGTTQRTVYRAECWREGDFVYVEVEANAFLAQMMRGIVGTLIWVGEGRLRPEDFQHILEARDRRLARNLAPPQGLCLMRIVY